MDIAFKGKGVQNAIQRIGVISQRYGLTSGKMEAILARFASILRQFDCSATFPIPASALVRSNGMIEKYQQMGIEFAVHGYHHVDHTSLSLPEQLSYFERARRVFESRGLVCNGFRSPYLRWNEATLTALNQAGFIYEGSQGLAWDVVNGVDTASYRHVLNFYGAISATNYPALPRWENGLVRIPYCLPDDEALVDRFHLEAGDMMSKLWLAILDKTYALGELFTLGLHPERIELCEAPLIATLQKARALSPAVWIARLDEIARWWIERSHTVVTVTPGEEGELSVSVRGPIGVTILTRGVSTSPAGSKWDGHYQRISANEISLRCDRRPFIGVSPSSPPDLSDFLRQQGYIVEATDSPHTHSFFVDRPAFDYEDERQLLAQIEGGDFPLVRLGRWPNGARSALCVTGDIDALTIWDYGLRFLGR